MDRTQIGLLMCFGAFLVPTILGGFIGAWFQRRIYKLGKPGAFLPGFIRKILEEGER